MVRVLVMGHGGYADGVKRNLEMVVGIGEHMHFLDLTKEMDYQDLENKIDDFLKTYDKDQVLFACDVLGASPFRAAAMQTASNPTKYITVAGLNAMAYIELSMSNEGTLTELAEHAMETAKASIVKFPED